VIIVRFFSVFQNLNLSQLAEFVKNAFWLLGILISKIFLSFANGVFS
jgi:hypothetical protein